jgi:hypothetical protein
MEPWLGSIPGTTITKRALKSPCSYVFALGNIKVSGLFAHQEEPREAQ